MKFLLFNLYLAKTRSRTTTLTLTLILSFLLISFFSKNFIYSTHVITKVAEKFNTAVSGTKQNIFLFRNVTIRNKLKYRTRQEVVIASVD